MSDPVKSRDGFLARWSERKRSAAATDEHEPSQDTAEDETEAELAANRAAAEAIDLETVTAETDFTVFLKKGVPVALRRAALQKLWRLDPLLANLDGLNDYDLNYADPAMIMKTFDSAWQAGRGYITKETPEDETPTVETGQAAPEENEDQDTDQAPAATGETAGEGGLATEPDGGDPPQERPDDEEPAYPRVPLRKRLGLS